MTETSPQRIINLASAFYESCVLFAASDCGVFDKLASAPASDAVAVAEACGLNERGTRLLLNACVALGLLDSDGDGYRNSPEAAAFLVSGSSGDLSKAIRYNRDVYAAWGRLPEMVRTGRPVEKPEVHLGEDKERTRGFVMAMHGRALGIGRSVVPALNLAGCRRLLDVGGGPGTYSVLIAQANAGVTSTVLDLPGIVAVADELITKQGMQDRVKTLAGDYHTAPFPPEQDVILFFGVLHQEPTSAIRELFSRAYGALKPGGTVYVLDMMTDATRAHPTFSALFAVNMALTAEHGWVFSDGELSGWLGDAGFADFVCRRLPPPMPHWLANARKPS